MKLGKFGKSLAIGGFSLAILMGAQSASAQTWNEEYREWQEAQRRAQEEYRDYQRTRSRGDYRDWQQAQRQAQAAAERQDRRDHRPEDSRQKWPQNERESGRNGDQDHQKGPTPVRALPFTLARHDLSPPAAIPLP